MVGANQDVRGQIEVYAISESQLTDEERQDVFLVKGKMAFETGLSRRMWIEGFEIFSDPKKVAKWERWFDDLLKHEHMIQYDPVRYKAFDNFVNDVFRH